MPSQQKFNDLCDYLNLPVPYTPASVTSSKLEQSPAAAISGRLNSVSQYFDPSQQVLNNSMKECGNSGVIIAVPDLSAVI
jgi:hypothetical protein